MFKNLINIVKNSVKSYQKPAYSYDFSLSTLVKKEKWSLSGALGFMFISSGVTISIPYIMGKLIDITKNSDENQEKNNKKVIFNVFGDLKDKINQLNIDSKKVIISILLIGGIANFGRFYLTGITSQRMTWRLRQKLYTSVMSQEISVLEKTQSGDIISRINNDSALVGDGLAQNLIKVSRSSLSVLAGLGMMVYISPYLSLCSIGILGVIPVVAMFFGVTTRKISSELQSRLAKSSEKVGETIVGMKTIKIFDKENYELKSYRTLMDHWFHQANKDILYRGAMYSFFETFGYSLIIFLPLYGMDLINSAGLSTGQLSSFIIYASFTTINFSSISSGYNELMKVKGASHDILNLINHLQYQPLTTPSDHLLLEPNFKLGNISLNSITYSWRHTPQLKLLRNLSLTIAANSHTAIIGSSGCGKSTIAHLILRLYNLNDLEHGGIVDSRIGDISRISLADWRKYVCGVLQDGVVFSGSIYDNIIYGLDENERNLNTNISLVEELMKAFQLDTIDGGINKEVGVNGQMLSEGQKQRILLARCVMKKPQLLILDEATSALDLETEAKVLDSISTFLPDTTILSITHKPSVMQRADWVYAMDDGQVKWQGTNNELKQLNRNRYNFENFDVK